MKKNVVLSGYYGFNNIGDEAVLVSIIQALRRELPDVHITVLSNDPVKTEKQYGVKAVNRWRPEQIAAVLRNCDLFISGGGSLLQDVTGPKSILYYLALIRWAGWWKRPVMIYAQGIGPVKRPWAQKLMGRILNKVDFITVRDDFSRRDLEAVGVNRTPIVVTVDPVMGWEETEEKLIPENLQFLNRGEGKFAGISLRHWAGMDTAQMADLCDHLVEQGFQVIFLPFHFPGDISVCREVAKLMKQKSYLIKDNLTPEVMMQVVGKMHFVIGMRLHALIMAGTQGIPFVAVSYDPKVERYAQLMGQAVACSVETMSCSDLKDVVEQILRDYSLIKEDLLDKALACRSKARETAQLAVKLITGQ